MRSIQSARFRWMAVALLIGLLSLAAFATVRPEGQTDDEATKIYQLARRLYDENTTYGSFTIWVNGDIGSDMTARRTTINGGDPLADFSLTLFKDDSSLQSKDMKGPYILNFWSSWCSVCRAEFALFEKKMDDQSLRVPVIFLDTLDFQGLAAPFIADVDPEHRLTIAFDQDSKLFSSLWLTVNPDTVLVDAEGRIQAIQIGTMTDLSLEFFNEIAEHPGLGAFDRLHPDAPPAETTPNPEATPDATAELQPSPTPA